MNLASSILVIFIHTPKWVWLILAAVLFLVGIGSSFKLHTIRYALVTFGSALLIISIVLILRQPGLPG